MHLASKLSAFGTVTNKTPLDLFGNIWRPTLVPEIEFRYGLPKTRSGKLMCRVLKAWGVGLPTDDLSTMDESLDFNGQDGH